MTGVQTCALPILTARGFELDDEESIEDVLRLSAVVMKPFSPRELVMRVYEILKLNSTPHMSRYGSESALATSSF